MEYTVRKDTAIIHAIQYDGTMDGIRTVNRFLTVHEQDTAIATPLNCSTEEKEKLYCNISYVDPKQPRCYFMSPFEYFVLRDDGTRFVIPEAIFNEIYQTGDE